MTLAEYDAFVSGMSVSPYIQGPDVAAQSVPVASGVSAGQPAGPTAMATRNGNGKPMMTNGVMGQPVKWWIFLLAIFAGLMWLSRRYGYAPPTFWALLFGTLYFILMSNFLKVLASRFTVPGLSPLIIAA